MLNKLRGLNDDSKRKIVLVCASTLTLAVFIFWIFSFSGIFVNSVNDTMEKGASAYSAFEQNIEKVYNTMTKMVPKSILDVTNKNTNIQSETPATSSDVVIK